MGNIALNGNVSADSSVAPFAASRAVDGVIAATNRWVGEVPCSLKLTLPANKLVNRWVVKNMSSVVGWPSSQYKMLDYKLQGGNNGVNWTDIDSVTGNTLTTTDRTIATPVYYPYYRVYVSRGLNCNNKIASIMEFELYEAPATSQYLSALTINNGTLDPVFGKNTYNYTASVGTDVSSITVTPTAETPSAYGQNAQIKVNGVAVASGVASTPVPLNIGSNTINIDVTSALGGVVQRYTIIITRASSPYLTQVDVTYPSGRSSFETKTITISTNQTEYSIDILDTASSVTIKPTAQDTSATILVNGQNVPSGQTSASINVTLGMRIPINVTSNIGTDNNAYMITIA